MFKKKKHYNKKTQKTNRNHQTNNYRQSNYNSYYANDYQQDDYAKKINYYLRHYKIKKPTHKDLVFAMYFYYKRFYNHWGDFKELIVETPVKISRNWFLLGYPKKKRTMIKLAKYEIGCMPRSVYNRYLNGNY